MIKHGDGRARIPSAQRVEVEVTELLSGLKFVCLKEMLKIHRNEKDEVVKHRARVYIQKPGKDFQEVFAPACDPDGNPADISYGSLPVHLFEVVKMSR